MVDSNLDSIFRHITNVHQNCKRLADKILERNKKDDEDLAWTLLHLGMIHDASKFTGIERLCLNPETKDKNPEAFEFALKQHYSTNPHHPEHWENGILDMPSPFLAEMVCDWYARSNEFGKDLREWIKGVAFPKYSVTENSKKGKQIFSYVDMLLEKPFERR
jgi:hypothetical protein